MPLAAAQVIDAVAARLAPVVLSDGRVFTDRAWPLDVSQLPAWRVTADDESVERQYVSQPVNEHRLQISCEGLVRAVAGVDDAMHALAAQGMTTLFAEPVPHDLQLSSISRRVSTEGEAAVGVITISLVAVFAVDQSAPETIL